jgi:hypothetical protein
VPLALASETIVSREKMMKLIYGREIRVQQLQMNEMGGGANRDRTGDLLNAIQALSQLSYSPTSEICNRCGGEGSK